MKKIFTYFKPDGGINTFVMPFEAKTTNFFHFIKVYHIFALTGLLDAPVAARLTIESHKYGENGTIYQEH